MQPSKRTDPALANGRHDCTLTRSASLLAPLILKNDAQRVIAVKQQMVSSKCALALCGDAEVALANDEQALFDGRAVHLSLLPVSAAIVLSAICDTRAVGSARNLSTVGRAVSR